MRYVIIGAGIAGATAAETIRENDKEGEIILISGEKELVYNRILLTKYFKAKLERPRLFVKTPESLTNKNITLKLGVWVQNVDTAKKEVIFGNGEVLAFDKLLIATGGRPKKWNIPGVEKQGVFHFHTLGDTEALSQFAKNATRAAVVGGGFISLDLMDIFLNYQLETHLFLRGPYYWKDLMDAEQSLRLIKKLESLGVIVHPNQTVVEILGDAKVKAVKTNTGLEVPVDVVGYGIGIERYIEFLSGSNIKTNRGVAVNEYLESSVPGIFAAGDSAEFFDLNIGKTHVLGNWDNAMHQGKAAGMNMVGQKTPYQELTSYSISIGGLTVAVLGNTVLSDSDEVVIRKNETDYIKILLGQNKVIGAVFVGGIKDLMMIKKLIVEKKALSEEDKARLKQYESSIAAG